MAARADFYDRYVAAIKALSAERENEYLNVIKQGKVALKRTECYAVSLDTICGIAGRKSNHNSNYFAILYRGWPIDSQANPLRVKAVFRKIHASTSTSGGAIVPCSVIDEYGLQVQVSLKYRR